jgi:hypothetical protein
VVSNGAIAWSIQEHFRVCNLNGCQDYIPFIVNPSGTFGCSPDEPNKTSQLSLVSSANEKPPRPAGAEGDGKSTYNMVAKVTEGGKPKVGMTVTFKVDVKANTGGHDHHDTSRPKGTLSATTAVTDTQGEAKLTFTSSEFAGTHTVTATCTDCKPNAITKEHEFEVKVPDLVALPPGDGYVLQGNTSEIGKRHLGNHFFTKSASGNLLAFIKTLAEHGWKPVAINDGSLIWGGRFDIRAGWGLADARESHQEHRTGEEVDISVATGTDPQKTKSAYDEFCKNSKVGVPTTILWHDIPPKLGGKYPLHFHLRLNGLFSGGSNVGKLAKCKRDSGKD